jgi:hypothetical protein
MDKFKMAEYFSVEAIIALYAMGYITICAGGDIEIIMKEREEG